MTDKSNNASVERRPIERRVPEDKRIPLSGRNKNGKPRVGFGPVFWIVWLAIILVIAIAWVVVLNRVSGLLVEYEQSQPKYVAEEVFEKYFRSCDYDYLVAHSTDMKISPAEDLAVVTDYARGLFGSQDSEWHYTQTSSDDPDVLKYSVSVGKNHVGSFTLVKSGQKSEKLQLELYTLGETEISLTPLCGANIYAPAGAVVKVNGMTLGDEYKYGDPVVLDEAVYFPEGDEAARTMQNYFIDGLFIQPTVTVSAADGSVDYELSFDPETVVYRADSAYIDGLVSAYNQKIADEEARRQEEERLEAERKKQESDAIRAEIGEYVVTAVQTYARWMQDDATKAERNKYFDTSSDFFNSLDKLISQSYIMWHKSYRFDDVVAENYRYESDDKTAVAAHISFTQVLIECTDPYGDKNYPEWKNDINVTVRLHLVDGKWLIYDIRND